MLHNLLQLALLALLAPVTVLAAAHGSHHARSHHELARRAEGDIQMWKRIDNSKWSYYNVQTGNAGSCGRFHQNSDFTVAMNVAQMNPSLCFKTIRMTYNGKSTVATISDTCPGCPYGGLDLTEGLFSFFASHAAGIIYGSWDFTDAAPPPPPPPPRPTSTWTPPPPPPTTTRTTTTSRTTTTTPPPTTTSHSTTTTTTSSTTSNSTTTTTTINYNSGAASGLASPTGGANATVDRVPGQANNLMDLSQAFVQIGAVAMAGHDI